MLLVPVGSHSDPNLKSGPAKVTNHLKKYECQRVQLRKTEKATTHISDARMSFLVMVSFAGIEEGLVTELTFVFKQLVVSSQDVVLQRLGVFCRYPLRLVITYVAQEEVSALSFFALFQVVMVSSR